MNPLLSRLKLPCVFTIILIHVFSSQLQAQSKPNVSISHLYPKIAAAEPGSLEYHKLIFELIDAGRSNQPDSTIKYTEISLEHNPKRLQPYHFRAEYMLADAWSIKGNYKLADSIYRAIENEIPELKDSLPIADYYNCRGVNSIEMGDAINCIEYFQKAYDYIRYSHPSDASKCIANVANIFSDIDMEDSCLHYNLIALDMRLAIQDTNGLESSYANIGTVYFKRKDYRRALDYTYTADALRGLPDFKICSIAINMINSYKRLGMRDSAFFWVDKNLASAFAMNSDVRIARGIFQKGELFRFYDEYDSSLHYMLEALPGLEANTDTMGNRTRYYELGLTYLKLKNYKKAHHYLDIAFRYTKEFNERDHLLAASRELGKAKLGLAGREDLIHFYEETESLADSLHTLQLESFEHELLIKFETEKTENALLNSELELLNSRGMISRQRVYIIGLLVLCILMLSFILLVRYNRRLKQEKRDEQVKNLENQESMRMVLTGEEQERQRIARELHDGLGQQLTLIQLKMELLEDEADEPNAPLKETLQALKAEVVRANEELRNISHAMMPANLEIGTLIDALRGLIRRDYTSLGLELTLNEQLAPEHQLTKTAQHTLYRVCQEALSNSQKHGNASRIEIKIKSDSNHLHLFYSDNGIGFSLPSIKPGLGLSNIRQRVQALHGELKMESSLGQGFKMSIQIPIVHCMMSE